MACSEFFSLYTRAARVCLAALSAYVNRGVLDGSHSGFRSRLLNPDPLVSC